MTLDQQKIEEKREVAKKEGFRRWMTEPMTRAMISTIPKCDNLEIILQAAYESGFGGGAVATTILFLEYATRPSR